MCNWRLKFGGGRSRTRGRASHHCAEVVCVGDARTHVWNAAVRPSAELEQDGLDQGSMIENNARGHVRFYPRRNNEGRHAHAISSKRGPILFRRWRGRAIVKRPMS